MKIFITGIPGTGKSTLAKGLSERGVAVHDIDSTAGLCHWRNKTSREKASYYTGIGRDWLDEHEYICDLEHTKRLLDSADIVVVVGMSHNLEEILPLFDKVILLYCSEASFLRRLRTRTENEFGKDAGEEATIQSWRQDFERRMLDRGAIPVDTDQPIETVIERVFAEIDAS